MVAYQHFRDELISILHILANMQYQQEIWAKGRPPKDGTEDFDWPMHFLLDDFSLADNPAAEIGGLLEDNNEAEVVGKVTRPMLDVFKEIGGTREPYEYISHPKWLEVVEAAKIAIQVIK